MRLRASAGARQIDVRVEPDEKAREAEEQKRHHGLRTRSHRVLKNQAVRIMTDTGPNRQGKRGPPGNRSAMRWKTRRGLSCQFWIRSSHRDDQQQPGRNRTGKPYLQGRPLPFVLCAPKRGRLGYIFSQIQGWECCSRRAVSPSRNTRGAPNCPKRPWPSPPKPYCPGRQQARRVICHQNCGRPHLRQPPEPSGTQNRVVNTWTPSFPDIFNCSPPA
jgi:hypothetical protein